MNNRGDAFAVRPDKQTALSWFRHSAKAGNPSGQTCLGDYLCGGGPIKRDQQQAMMWYRRAARQGESCAACNISQMYADGRNQRAFFWYQKAAAMSDGDALVEVGVRSKDVLHDPKYALRCFRKALQSADDHISEAGRERARLWIGRSYFEGCGTKQSNAKALAWLSKANADHDNPEG